MAVCTVNISSQTTAFDSVNESIGSSVSAFGGYLENSSFIEKISTGLSQNLLSLKDNAEALLIAFISSLPTIIVCAVLLAAGFCAVRKIWRKVRRTKRVEKKPDAKSEGN